MKRDEELDPLPGKRPPPHVHEMRIAVPKPSNGTQAAPFNECVICYTTQERTT